MTVDFELRSEKQNVREKALSKINHVLVHRTNELIELLSDSNADSDITWSRLYDTAHESIVYAAGQLAEATDERKLLTLTNKIGDKINIIQRIVSLSYQDRVVRISLKSIVQKTFQCLRHRTMVQYFGDCYLQIVTKHVLNAKLDLSDIKQEEWSELLTRCFQVYDHDFFTQKLILLQCIASIVDVGLNYSSLILDLHKFITKLSEIANEGHKSNAANVVYGIVYSFCKNLAADYRFAICELTENVLSTIIKSFPKVGDETKVLICKLLHISLVVHNPQMDGNVYELSACKSTWNLHIRNMMHLVETEISRLRNNRLANSVVCEHFVLFASKLCSVAFWDMSVWDTSSSEQASKRRKQSDKIQGITERIEIKPKVFCWRWLSILTQLATDHPCYITDEDFQPLLQLCFDFQSTIELPIHIQTLRRLIQVLLVKELEFDKSSLVNKAFCDDLWEKIARNATRSSATNRPNLLENTKLLETLVTYKQLPSAFIQSIFDTYLSSSIPRTNQSILLLIAIFQHVHVDALNNSERLRSDTLTWLHTTSMAMELKNISSCDVIDVQLKAELSVLCLFSKIDSNVSSRSKHSPFDDKSNMSDTETKILFRCLKKMIFAQSIDRETVHCEPLPQANEIRSIINETILKKLEAMLLDVEMSDNPFEDAINVLSLLHLFVLILNELIAYKAMDQKSLDASYFTKKMKFKIEQLDLCMIRLVTSRYEGKENMELIEKLLEVMNETVHPLLTQIIKSHSLKGTINWLKHVVNEREERNSRCLLLKSYNQLKFDQKIQYKAFTLLCFLSDGINGEDAFDVIDEFEFNLLSNGDLCIVLHLIQAVSKQPKKMSQADWSFKYLKQLCMMHHKSNPISERIIDSIPIVVEYINTFDNMTDEMITIMRDFLKKIKKNRYSPQIAVKMLLHMKDIARSYRMHFGNDEFENLFAQMKDFLSYRLFDVQFATIRSLIQIFDKRWIGDGVDALRLKMFYRKLFDFLFDEESQSADVVQPDDQARYICVRGQLIAGLISSSFILRKKSWFLLAELCFKHQLTSELIRPIVLALCCHHEMGPEMLVNENLSYLVSEWLIRNYQLEDFPWYLTNEKSQNDFFRGNVKDVTICILQHRPNALGHFAETTGENPRALMEAVLPRCLAYITPILAGCDETSDKYKENAGEMKKILQENVGDLSAVLREQFLTVTENLLSNLWDEEKFKDFFDLEIDHEIESHHIDINVFTKSLEYLQHICESTNKNVHLITDFCANRPLQVYNFLLFKKLQLQNTKYVDEQLIHLFQITVVVDKVAAFFVSDACTKKNLLVNKKSSLLRDIVYFIGNILISAEAADKLKLATCRYLLNFGGQILPSCAQIFEPFLNFTISCLIPLVQLRDNHILSESALKCIKFFVIDQKSALANEIALLDNFPQNDQFNYLREIHSEVKYGGRTFSLTEEIEYFLKVDHRKIEGLVALKEHLSLKKGELIQMYAQLQDTRGFSEDCEKSLIHRLVFTLLQFVQGFDATKAVEAAKCLGELGPSDLSSIVLKPDHQLHTYEFASNFDKASQSLCKAAFTELNRLLVHRNALVLKEVSSSLVFLLKSDICKSLVEDFPYLHLFQAPPTHKRKIYNVSGKQLDLETLFTEEENSSYSDWLKRLTKLLFDLFEDEHLQKVAVLEISFADAMLPLLIKMILASKQDDYRISLQRAVLTFFEKHFEMIQNPPATTKDQPIYLNKAIIKCMITVAECIRMNNLNTVSKIRLNNMHVAKAAQYCEAYFTSIMYAELWALEIEASSQYTLVQIKNEPHLQEVMKK
ncbi:Serine-protein kinase ATM, partial [Pseudolycoriella hygida]